MTTDAPPRDSSRLDVVLRAIDAANSADPNSERDGAQDRPAALLYGERMSGELTRLFPDASEHLRIAARGQHIERWRIPRDSYPEGRAGYLAWRTAQAAAHAERVGAMMDDAGYGAEDIDAVGRLLRKEGIKRNPEMQRLEDVICFVFLRWYFADFAAQHSPEDVLRIVTRTARKMSAGARARATAEFDLPAEIAAAFDA
jgi:hypothetical protein